MSKAADLANEECTAGYLDGRNLDNPEPSSNRSESYRHGFMVGRAEKLGRPMPVAKWLREAADAADLADKATAAPIEPPRPKPKPNPWGRK